MAQIKLSYLYHKPSKITDVVYSSLICICSSPLYNRDRISVTFNVVDIPAGDG